MSVQRRVALVLGSARGLGLAVARRLASDGAAVHVVYRSSAQAAPALEREFPDRVHQADALDPSGVQRLMGELLEQDGRLDTLVHAVGEYATGPLEGFQLAQLQRMFASNVESAFVVLGASRAALRASSGSAVFFGCAGNGHARAWRESAAYAAAKTALLTLVRSWAVEEASHGVRINMISPGHIPHEHAAPDTNDPKLWKRIPMGAPGTPEDVAAAAAWLASPAAGYVTGVNLEVAGGWML
jgi:3-oxoacyl-[acyl-carrier protein] reductase